MYRFLANTFSKQRSTAAASLHTEEDIGWQHRQ